MAEKKTKTELDAEAKANAEADAMVETDADKALALEVAAVPGAEAPIELKQEARKGEGDLPESVFLDTLPGETQEEGAKRRIDDYERAQMKLLRENKAAEKREAEARANDE